MDYTRTNLIAAVFLSLISAVSLCSSGCGKCSNEPDDDETRIRKIIELAAALAEKHDIDGLMDLATENLTVDPGQKDRQAIRGILFMAFRKYGNFSVKFPRPVVDINPGGVRAKAIVPFIIVRGGSDAPNLAELYDDPKGWLEKVGNIADVYNLELWFDKGGDEWLVNEAKLLGYGGVNGI